MASDELLREALVDLLKAREHEEQQRRKSEALLAGLQVLIKPLESSRMFKELLEVMRGVLNFDQAFVLLRQPDGSLTATVATSELFLGGRWQPGPTFQRVLAGSPATVFNVAMVEEWRDQPATISSRVTSALHVLLRNGEQAAMLVCTHPEASFFSISHQRLAENFSTLAAQALLNAERRQMEAQLFQARKMEALGILAGGIAHDFKNILTPIIINCQMAMLEAENGGPLHQNLRQIEQAAGRAGSLINQILDFNRQGPHEPRPIHLGPVIKEAIKFLRSTIAPNIVMEYKKLVERDMVAADPTQIVQVIMNLALNAAYAMGEQGGELTITLSAADKPPALPPPTPNPANRWLKLVVSDTGSGIAPENLNRIFDPFFTTKSKGEGSGMGLAVVHGIISKHGGTIIADSEPGRGSSFEIMLPEYSGKREQSVISEQELPPAGNRERILFVDDELPVVEAFTPVLEKLGYQVDITTSSKAALEIFRRRPTSYDLLITDYSMPEMNGDELAREVMKINPRLPVILCTGFSGRLKREECLRLGIAAYVSKPFNINEFAGIIRRALQNDCQPPEGSDGQGTDH